MGTELLDSVNKTEAKSLFKLNVYRLDKTNGIGIYVKSPAMEDFIRANAANPDAVDSVNKANFNESPSSGWAKHLGYKLNGKAELKTLHSWGSPIIQNSKANLSFLTVKGLAAGVTFEFEGMYSQQIVESFISDTKRQMKLIWNDCIKKENQTIICEIREIE